MIKFIQRMLTNMKISTDIVIRTLILVMIMSFTYMIVNAVRSYHAQLILNRIDSDVTKQLEQLNTQQKSFLDYYTTLTSEIVQIKLSNFVNYVNHTANFAFFNNIFDKWETSSSTAVPVIGCTETIFQDKVSSRSKVNSLSGVYGQFIGDTITSSGFFSSSTAFLSTEIKTQLSKQWGKNLRLLEWGIKMLSDLDSEKYLGTIVIMVSMNTQTSDDYMGVYSVFPGTCENVEYYKPKIGNILV